jgi:hypothetical protein
MLVAIGVAATAVRVVTSFLILTYVKFKKFSATRRNSGVSKAAIAWSTALYTGCVHKEEKKNEREWKWENEKQTLGRKADFWKTGCCNAKKKAANVIRRTCSDAGGA